MTIKGLIFDMDGVLVDTVPAHYRAWERMFTEQGYAFDDHVYREHVDGRLRLDGARAVMVNHTEDEVKAAASLKNEYYLGMVERGEFEIFQIALDYVRARKAEGFKLAAASSSSNVHLILEKIGLHDAFDVIIGGRDVSRGKPNPEIFLTAAERLGLSVSESVVVEDSESGVAAAKAGGFFCYGLAHDGPQDHLHEADRIIKRLTDIDLNKDMAGAKV